MRKTLRLLNRPGLVPVVVVAALVIVLCFVPVIVAVWAFLAMVAEDIIGVANQQAAARNNAHLAGITDVLGWLCVLVTNHFALNALNTHDFKLQAMVIGAVTAANYVGSVAGVEIGRRWIKTPVDPAITELERRVTALEAHNQGA